MDNPGGGVVWPGDGTYPGQQSICDWRQLTHTEQTKQIAPPKELAEFWIAQPAAGIGICITALVPQLNPHTRGLPQPGHPGYAYRVDQIPYGKPARRTGVQRYGIRQLYDLGYTARLPGLCRSAHRAFPGGNME